jgi:hypothetical protein
MHYLNAATVSVMRPKEAKNSQTMKEQEQQMEDSLPECCHSVCDETKGGEEELTNDEVQQQQMIVCPQLENRK